MNTLTFRCSPGDIIDVPVKGGGVLRDLHVDAILDGKLVSEGLIDVSDIVFATTIERCSFFFFTCSCGIAGCAGYHLPLDHCRQDGKIVWKIEDEKLARDFGASEVSFDADQLDQAVAELRAEVERYEAEGCFSDTMRDVDYADENDELHRGVTLSEVEDEALQYFQGQCDFQKTIEAHNNPEDPAVLRFSWNAPIDAGEEEHFYEMRAVDVAAILLRLSRVIEPSDAPKVAQLQGATEVIREFASNGDTIAAEKSFALYRRFLHEEYEQYDDGNAAQLFFVDADGPFVRHP